jgi:hypothetical protein
MTVVKSDIVYELQCSKVTEYWSSEAAALSFFLLRVFFTIA